MAAVRSSHVKPLPPHIRQRLRFQNLLNTTQYVKNTQSLYHSRHKREEIKERVCPQPSVVSERTQTKEVLDAETNTKWASSSTIVSQKSKFRSRCSTALAKSVVMASSPCVEIARRLRKDSNDKDSTKDLPETKRRRGILKKVLADVTPDGTCSMGTATDKKKPTLDRILKENHIFLKYSKSKTKKKRVRMEKKAVLSFLKKDQESVKSFTKSYKSIQALEASGDKRTKSVGPADDNDDNLSDQSYDTSLERKPASLALRASDGAHDVLDAELDAVSDTSRRSRVSSMSSAPQLSALKKLSRHPLLRQVPLLNVCAKSSEKCQKRSLCRVPKERLYFKNVFSFFPGIQTRRR